MHDNFRDYLKAEVVEVSEGYARVKGVVDEQFLNFHGTAHGSYIMALADFAFALAVNTSDVRRVAVSFRMDFLKPAFEGDELTAEAKIMSGKRLVFCELKVKRGEEVIAKGDAIAFRVS